jgi:hypothetical protein
MVLTIRRNMQAQDKRHAAASGERRAKNYSLST